MRRLVALLIPTLLALGTTAPAIGAPTLDEQWQVPAPALFHTHGVVGNTDWPNCHVGEIHSAARTVKSTYSVLGFVRLRGHKCVIPVSKPIVALLDANGRAIDVPIRTAAADNRGINPGFGAAGQATSWGFALRGSWCGSEAVYVRVELKGGRLLRVPLPGAKPTCVKGGGMPVVIRGSFGAPGEPVQAAPTEWSALTADLSVDDTLSGARLTGLSVTLTNTSPDPIRLDPCPRYVIAVQSANGASSGAGANNALGGCPAVPRGIPGGGSRTFNLPDSHFNREDFGPAGTKVTVTFAIAGLAPSAVQSRLV